jgi:hypothetical protein
MKGVDKEERVLSAIPVSLYVERPRPRLSARDEYKHREHTASCPKCLWDRRMLIELYEERVAKLVKDSTVNAVDTEKVREYADDVFGHIDFDKKNPPETKP